MSENNRNKGLSLAFWLNLGFSIIEGIGGVLTNSTAILADAFHDFMDAMAIGAAVLLEKISGKKRTKNFSYGYKRFSLLAALGMSLFLLIGALFMVWTAIRSFQSPTPIHSLGMLGLAVLGIVINGFAFLRVRKGGSGHHEHTHNHAHGHSHSHDDHNQNSKAVMLHLLEDVLGWIAVLIGAIVIYFTNWYWIDGILAIGIAVFISVNATRNIVATMKILLQAIPHNIDIQRLSQEVLNIPEVRGIHDVHVWTMDGAYHVGSVHLIIDPDFLPEQSRILLEAQNVLLQNNIKHATIQIETEQDSCPLLKC